MIFPRVAAVIFVILLIGSLSLCCIGVLTLHQLPYILDKNVEHVDGKIVAIESNMDFVLETAAGQHLHFHCGNSCRTSLKHLQRHLHEQANTDVVYVQESDTSLVVLDVD